MKRLSFLMLMLFLVCLLGASDLFAVEPSPSAAAEVNNVSITETDTYEWKRCQDSWCISYRKATIKYFYPSGAAANSLPLVIFSTPYGATESSWSNMARHIASHGFVVMIVKPWMYLFQNEIQTIKRAKDIIWIMDMITETELYPEYDLHPKPNSEWIEEGGEVPACADITKVAISGASYGSSTAEIIGGGRAVDGYYYRDTRIDYVVAFSSAGWGLWGLENPDYGDPEPSPEVTFLFDRSDWVVTGGNYYFEDDVEAFSSYGNIPSMEINGYADTTWVSGEDYDCSYQNGCRSAVWDNKCGPNGSVLNNDNICHTGQGNTTYHFNISVASKSEFEGNYYYDCEHVEIIDDTGCSGSEIEETGCYDNQGQYQVMMAVAFLRYYMKNETQYSWYWTNDNWETYAPMRIEMK